MIPSRTNEIVIILENRPDFLYSCPNAPYVEQGIPIHNDDIGVIREHISEFGNSNEEDPFSLYFEYFRYVTNYASLPDVCSNFEVAKLKYFAINRYAGLQQ